MPSLPSLLAFLACFPPLPAPQAPTSTPVLWLQCEQPGSGGRDGGRPERLPVLAPIDAGDPRRVAAERLVANEPADFLRALLGVAWPRFGVPATWPEGRLAVLLEEGGNHARIGFRLHDGATVADHPDVPYLALSLDADALAVTLLHEGGHLLHDVATRGGRPQPSWTPFPHTTFAVTDPLTALAEGYAIHFETLLGHYGREPERRAHYHRAAPRFEAKNSKRAEYFAPVADLLTFAQGWARYTGVRDTLAVFDGVAWPGDYLRAQFDPMRDRASLKNPNAMLASEGVVAAVLFWTAVGLAEARGAVPGSGLQQPGLAAAELELLQALASAKGDGKAFRPDLLDVVGQCGAAGSEVRQLAITRTIEVTRGVTADAAVRGEWHAFYTAGLHLDLAAVKPSFQALEARRQKLRAEAVADPAVLRRALGPVLPVKVPAVPLSIPAFGEPFPLAFDANAATALEWRMVPGLTRTQVERLLAERDRAPFTSFADLCARAGIDGAKAGLEPEAL